MNEKGMRRPGKLNLWVLGLLALLVMLGLWSLPSNSPPTEETGKLVDIPHLDADTEEQDYQKFAFLTSKPLQCFSMDCEMPVSPLRNFI